MNAWAILALFIFFDALSAQFPGGKSKAKCLKEMRMTAEQLENKKESLTLDQNLKCYFRCILKSNYLIDDNRIVPGAFKRIVGPLLSKKTVAEVESSCHLEARSPRSPEQKCDFAYLLYKCYNFHTKRDLMSWLKKHSALSRCLGKYHTHTLL